MWVRVSDGLVVVRMGMTHRGRDTGVHVAVVAIVVAVAVCVRETLVGMFVLVPRGQHHGKPRDHEDAGTELS